MLKRIINKRILLYSFIVFAMLGLLIYPKDTMTAARDGIGLCETVIIPSLFPFFIFSSLAITTGLFDDTAYLFSPIMKLFRLSGSCAPAIALGLVAGFPVGAKTAVNLYENGICTKQEAERLLSFCNNCGPAFILGTVGAGLWNSMELGFTLYIVQIISSLITGVIFGLIWHSDNKSLPKKLIGQKRLPLSKAFVSAVKGSAVSILYVCAFIVFFSVAVKLLYVLDIVPMLSKALAFLFAPFGLTNSFFTGIITGFFEITNGVKAAFGAVNTSAFIRLILTGIILGWSGLSVHCQVLIFLQGSGLSSKPYFLGKAVQSIISGIITAVAVTMIPNYEAVFYASQLKMDTFLRLSPLTLLYSALAAIVFIAAVFILVKIKGIRKKRIHIA